MNATTLFEETFQRREALRRLLWAIVILGVILRAGAYLWNTGFWYDEGWLIQNIQDKSFLGLAGKLANQQAAPLLYLWVLKILYFCGGLSELLLRAPSVIAAIAGMILMLALARRCVRPEAVLWALLLFAASDNILIYTARTKPYVTDALVVIVLLYAAVRLKDTSPLKYILVLGGLQAVFFWFSYTSVFVYGGVVIVGVGGLVRSRRLRDWIGFVVVNLLVAASIFVSLQIVGSDQRTDFLMQYWSRRGFPMGVGVGEVLKWPLDATYRYFEEAMRPIGVFAMLASIVAIVAMWRDRTRRFRLGLLAIPLVLNFLAACLRKYPWIGGRLSIWTIPILVLLTAEGWGAVLSAIRRRRERLIAAALGAAVICVPVVLGLYHTVWVGHRSAHGRPLVEHVLENVREGDHVAVAGSNEFGIYLRGRCPVDVTGGDYGSPRASAALEEPWDRCWLLVRPSDKNNRKQRDEFLRRCDVLQQSHTHDAELYLLRRSRAKSQTPIRQSQTDLNSQ